MPVWSSPFPCPIPQGWGPSVSFPGPKGSVLLFDSPDRVLKRWNLQHQCNGRELERIQQGCVQLLEFRDRGEHKIQPCWGLTAPAPEPDGILAGLLLTLLEAQPGLFDAYLQLEPQYLQRLMRSQHSPMQLLHEYLQKEEYASEANQTSNQQSHAIQADINKFNDEQLIIETLLEQQRAQQKRTRKLIARIFDNHPKG